MSKLLCAAMGQQFTQVDNRRRRQTAASVSCRQVLSCRPVAGNDWRYDSR